MAEKGVFPEQGSNGPNWEELLRNNYPVQGTANWGQPLVIRVGMRCRIQYSAVAGSLHLRPKNLTTADVRLVT